MPTPKKTSTGTPTTRAKKPAPTIKADTPTINQALQELGITVPFYSCRLVGNRLEFHLYGGQVKHWPPDEPAPSPAEGPAPSPAEGADK